MKKKKSVNKRKRNHQSLLQRHRQLMTCAVITVLVIILVGYLYVINHATETSRLVTFHDRGKNHVILTKATTVQDALADANISISPQDIVEPSINKNLLSTDSIVIISRARPVLVIDGALRQKVLTAAQSPNEIAVAANVPPVDTVDKAIISEANIIADGASEILTIERLTPIVVEPVKKPTPNALTISRGAQIFVDSNGVAHRETYYDLPMNIVINSCGGGEYTIRYDGAKIDQDGYVLVAAGYSAYPRCSIVETSMGPGKVYDTGGFALRYPHGFDLATDWTNNNGR